LTTQFLHSSRLLA